VAGTTSVGQGKVRMGPTGTSTPPWRARIHALMRVVATGGLSLIVRPKFPPGEYEVRYYG
jgi:hypothetical protein